MPVIKRANVDPSSWTYGAEHELADWNALRKLPNGFKRSPDYTIVNTNGVAAQPNTSVYEWGGEINTPPTSTVEDQADCLGTILDFDNKAAINYRSNLHVHVRIPGLKDDLATLKKLQEFIHKELPNVLDLIEPIPPGDCPGSIKRAKRRRVSHHTLLTSHRLQHQLEAKTVQEFFEREVPATKSGKPMWHAQPRLTVGLRQLLQTDTIEFRHFPGTISCDELFVCIEWCRDFLRCALNGGNLLTLYNTWYSNKVFPKFPEFNLEQEIRYQATASHNGLTIPQIKSNIKLIREGRFNGTEARAIARSKALGGKPTKVK